MNRLRKLVHHIRQREYRYLFKRVFPTGNPVFYACRIYVFELTNQKKFARFLKIVSSVNKEQMQEICLEDLSKFCSAFKDKESKFRERLLGGSRCFAAISNGEVASYVWVMGEHEHFPTNSAWRFKVPTGKGLWCYDMFVTPQHRGKGLFLLMLGHVADLWGGLNNVQLFGETAYSNVVSVNSHLKAGYSIRNQVDLVSIAALKFYFVVDRVVGRRRLDFRWLWNPNRERL